MYKTRDNIEADLFASTTNTAEGTVAAKNTRADRIGRVALPFWVTASAKKQLRMLAAENDTTQQKLMTQALNLLFKKYGRSAIA